MHSDQSLTKARVTQSDVARVAGVHNTTVSLSLRNSPSIPEETRKRIKAVADELGYFPDPTLQALVAYRKGMAPNRLKETLAYITHWDTRWGWRALPAHERAYLGAQRKAAELGYQLEHFWLGEPGMSQRRLSSVLYHRGITGAFFAAQGATCEELSQMDWPRLTAVKIGCYPRTPTLHRVSDDCGSMMRLALQQIHAAGFERIGLVMADWWDDLADQAWSEAFTNEQARHRLAGNSIPILHVAGGNLAGFPRPAIHSDSAEVSALGRWYDEQRPEVIIGFSPQVLAQLKRLGLVVPRDVAYVELCVESADQSIAGVRQNSENAGEVAATMLAGQIQQNARGIPKVATATLVNGSWCEGASLPAIRKQTAWTDERILRARYSATAVAMTG